MIQRPNNVGWDSIREATGVPPMAASCHAARHFSATSGHGGSSTYRSDNNPVRRAASIDCVQERYEIQPRRATHQEQKTGLPTLENFEFTDLLILDCSN